MNFSDSLILTIVDKLFVAILVLIVGFWLNHRLEKLKGQLAFQSALAPQRTASYAALWEKAEALSPRDAASLDAKKTEDLLKQLREWYYEKGGAMYLSLDTADLFLKGLKMLERPEDLRPKEITDSFSALRTQMKVDLGIYSTADAKVQIPKAS